MSLLTICRSVADNIGVVAPTTIIGNADPAARRLLQMARREGQVLSTRTNWIALVVEHVFVADGTSNYSLPADFRSLVNDTLWDRTRAWKMRGAMSPQQWQMYKSSIFGRATVESRWRLHIPSGGQAGSTAQFSIDPEISATNTTETFVYEYVSDAWVASSTKFSAKSVGPGGGTGYRIGDTITLAGGTYTTQAQLVVVAVGNPGNVLGAEIVSPGGNYSAVPTNPVAQASTSGTGSGAQFTMTWGGSPLSDWAADGDTAILDEDLIELGVIWRTLRRMGLAYDEELDEYNKQVDQAVARDGGTAVLQIASNRGSGLVGGWNVQEGNFPG